MVDRVLSGFGEERVVFPRSHILPHVEWLISSKEWYNIRLRRVGRWASPKEGCRKTWCSCDERAMGICSTGDEIEVSF
jgi:hypothetical protein